MPSDFTEDVIGFRQNTIVKFIEYVSDASSKKGLKNAICVLPESGPKHGVYQWEKIVQLKNIDIFGSDPYWLCFNKDVKDFVKTISDEVVTLCKRYHKEPQIWIQGFRVPEGREDEVSAAIKIAYDSGVRNIATWSFDAGACMSYISSDRPEMVWDIISAKYKELKA